MGSLEVETRTREAVRSTPGRTPPQGPTDEGTVTRPPGPRTTSDSFGRAESKVDARSGDAGGSDVRADPSLQAEVQARIRGEVVAKVQGAQGGLGTPAELIDNSKSTFDLVSGQLNAGKGNGAANILTEAARDLRAGMEGAGTPEKYVLDTLANNMDKRAAAYRAEHPNDVLGAAGSLGVYARNARVFGESIQDTHPEYGKYLQQVGQDSRIQGEILTQSAMNTKSIIGRGVAQTYRGIAVGSIDRDIANSGSINNFITGNRDELKADRKKMNTVFDFMDKKMEAEGLNFNEAWHGMFNEHRISSAQGLPGFATAHDAAAFVRDHDSTKGLLAPMADLSRGIIDGDSRTVDRARDDVVRTLRDNDQWDIAKQVLTDYQANASTSEGQAQAGQLADNERGEFWRAKAGQFVSEDLPVLLLTGVVTGGAGLGVRALGAAAGWGARAQKAAMVATELGAFVPTERVLSDAINGKRADWSASGMARDYALTVGGYGAFRALGAGWRAIRAKPVKPIATPDSRALPDGTTTRINPKDAAENIRALTRENQSAQTLSQRGFHIEQNPRVPGAGQSGVKNPDYLINGRIFDNYAPGGSSARNIAQNIRGKVDAEQASRIVLNLDDSAVTLAELRKQFADWPIDGLEQLLIVRGGKVSNFPLPQAARTQPWITLTGYPQQGQNR